MKNLLKCSSLLRVAVVIVVMAFMAGQVTETYAEPTTGGGRGDPHENPCCGPCQGGEPWQFSKTITVLGVDTTFTADGVIPVPDGKTLEIKSITYSLLIADANILAYLLLTCPRSLYHL